MFQNSYQGGSSLEVFSPAAKNPLDKWKTSGVVSKQYDKAVKGYIVSLESASAKMQLPRDEKKTPLGIVQPFLVFQIFLPPGKTFQIELAVSDSAKQRRRLMFTPGPKDLVLNPLHARIPNAFVQNNTWLNLCIDVPSIFHECFKGSVFRSIDLIALSASCFCRKIFSLKHPLADAPDPEISFDRLPARAEPIPKSLDFAAGVQSTIYLANAKRVLAWIAERAEESLDHSVIEESINTSLATAKSAKQRHPAPERKADKSLVMEIGTKSPRADKGMTAFGGANFATKNLSQTSKS